ncbi:PREDICTED: cip1-interacting zinc finger protein [Gekko japonicus]|uniref:Cip1-interacting zinc finger protein n=1 Tax=Gekko japonicus TaxID=146911 RepID=A0ABM1L7L0_GEKJA|nr:PREDICTED: cip1-interacting zinc finger protein [Gekko japonicus]
MFNQQQFQQQLLQLQHLLQHHPQQSQQQQQAGRGVAPPQQPPMLNLRAANQASLLNANPMLQRALLVQQMQGNLRGFNMAAAPVLQQFFPQATRHSLLGPPPVGVSLKPAHLAFPALPFQRQNRTFRKDFPRVPERKREADSAISSSSSSQTPGPEEREPLPEGGLVKAGPEEPGSSPSEMLRGSSPDAEPASKRLKSGDEESILDDALCLPEMEAAKSHTEETDQGKEDLVADTSKEKNFPEELKASEVVSSAGSLKVTIQQSSESRAISTTALKPAHWTSEMGAAETSPESTVKFYCYICKTNCCNQQNFQAHMAGVEHQQRLQEIQHMSNICFVSLLPMVKEQRPLAEKDGESQQRWCNTCQLHFAGDLIKHRRTQEHKLAKRSLRPFCTACSRHFKTPRKFVEHMKSSEHKQKAREVRLGEKEQGGPEDSEELITVDAVGCFEDDDDDDDEEEVEGEEDSEVGQLDGEDPLGRQVGLKEVSSGDAEGSEKYSPDTVYGPDFLVPVAGFLCRLCRTFYHSDSAARLAHCKSLMHFENFQRYKAARLQATAALTEAASSPRQGLADDHQTPPAARMERAEVEKEAGALTAASEEARQPPEEKDHSSAPRDSSAALPTDDAGVLIEDGEDGKNDFSTLSDHPLLGDAAAAVTGEPMGLCAREKEPSDESIQERSPGRAAADEDDPRANETLAGRDLLEETDPSSLAKGETSPGRRRSTRRRAR